MAKNDLMSAISGLSGDGKGEEKSESKSKEKDGGKKKPKVVNLGKAGSFKIKHPGASREAAKREGLTTNEWAHKHEHDSGVTGERARSAEGLMAMHHGGKK